jgi:uncharacterized lipoprotein YddW (UPF0748 family)
MSERRPARVVIVGLAIGLAAAAPAAAPAPRAAEVRGLWIQRGSLTSRDAIVKAVRAAKDAGFNTLLVQVRGRGEAFYRSDVEPRASDLDGQPAGFDPLATVIDLAREGDLKVHAWININLIGSGATLPRSRTHVAFRHPEWLMVPRALAATLRAVDPRSPGYLGALSRWTRANAETVEGLYLSPLVAAARDHTERVVAEIVSRYALDGVHFDYVRFPNPEFDYAPAALAEFRAAQAPLTTPGDRARFDRAAATDPTAWTTSRPNAWAAFRRDRLTSLVDRLAKTARAARPGLTVSAAVVPSAIDARDRTFQDWRAWAAGGLLDVLCPMIYTTESENFAGLAAGAIEAAGPAAVWTGIGAYRLPVARAADNVRAARRSGAAGVVVFSYDSLLATPGTSDYLAALRPVLLEAATGGAPGR